MACNGCASETLDLCSCSDGFSAFTITTSDFTMPAEGASVVVSVSNTGQYTGKWGAFGQVVFVSKLLGGSGYFGVASTTSTTMTLINIKNTGTGAYATNPAPGTVFVSGANVSPSGLQGLTGVTPTSKDLIYINYTNIANNVSGSFTTTQTTTLGAGLYLQNVDDSIEIEFDIANRVSGFQSNYKVLLQGVNIIPSNFILTNPYISLEEIGTEFSQHSVKYTITRVNSTTINLRMHILSSPFSGSITNGVIALSAYSSGPTLAIPIVMTFDELNLGGFNLANAIPIEIQTESGDVTNVTGTITYNLKVKRINKI